MCLLVDKRLSALQLSRDVGILFPELDPPREDVESYPLCFWDRFMYSSLP